MIIASCLCCRSNSMLWLLCFKKLFTESYDDLNIFLVNSWPGWAAALSAVLVFLAKPACACLWFPILTDLNASGKSADQSRDGDPLHAWVITSLTRVAPMRWRNEISHRKKKKKKKWDLKCPLLPRCWIVFSSLLNTVCLLCSFRMLQPKKNTIGPLAHAAQ
jgi:hypothetical protein